MVALHLQLTLLALQKFVKYFPHHRIWHAEKCSKQYLLWKIGKEAENVGGHYPPPVSLLINAFHADNMAYA